MVENKNFALIKAHEHDNIAIQMLNICVDSIFKLLEMNFTQASLASVFPSEWKKDKSNIKNNCPASFLPVCGKKFFKTYF